MASSAAKWREDQILIVCPGSLTTMAQLGCSELTPPAHRFPTRMFRDDDGWRPYHTFCRRRVLADGTQEEKWIEDVDSDEGAVYPLQGGRITHMDAFLAFLDHVHGMLITTYHNTPIVLMASPQWTRPDCEAIAQFIFEKTRTPALCLLHSALATQYGLKWPNMTVVDIGFEKVDVTAIHDGRVVNHNHVGSSLTPDQQELTSGGEVFTRRLMRLLSPRGFTRDMVEQLKASAICEVLPYAPNSKTLAHVPAKPVNDDEAAPLPPAEGQPPLSPSDMDRGAYEADSAVENHGPGPATSTEDEGVLDVAAIVTSGQTKEFLAKREKEKDKARPGRRLKDKEAAEVGGSARISRLPNFQRSHNTFYYEEIVHDETISQDKPQAHGQDNAEAKPEASPRVAPASGQAGQSDSGAPAATEINASAEAPTRDAAAAALVDADVAPPVADAAPPVAAPPAGHDAATIPDLKAKRVRRDMEIGPERFTFADRREIDRIVTAIYRTIQGIDDMYMRPACWDNLVFVGNGSRLRGLKENIMQTLQARHLVSPSSATMFTSELPSNMATPTGTGSQTPTGSFTGVPHQLSSSGVNPLLQAATTASTLGVATSGMAGMSSLAAAVGTPGAGSEAAGPVAGHSHFHSQTPTSIKMATLPTYLTEWTRNGFEEAMFLGAQVAARIAFCVHTNMDAQSIEAQRLMSLSRVDYNELGPKAVRTHSMLS
ncbi:hypothetical protein CDD81_3365 [Ophiocordyceps australis]|uniref:Actin-like protein ARP9 n=1 Tax=Ophiocordyceps australis TaxID=1399860 RepID=A0A2C5XS97_9HYPO|nr:hypothetical protein CDD81_3365 [Ophiocordyceps australis]